MSSKIDFKKTMKNLYFPSPKTPVIVKIPSMQFLMIDGKGSPGDSPQYANAVASLYPIAYKLKFSSKKKLEKDYTVPPLEGLWWAERMIDFLEANRDEWIWTMMIMTPEWITEEMFNNAIKNTLTKKPELTESIKKVELRQYSEGLTAQIMHIGPYANEHPTIMKLHDFIKENGGKFDGHLHKHHEIYLSDPRKANPKTMKTVIRQPFEYT
jgi:hypothetical protein